MKDKSTRRMVLLSALFLILIVTVTLLVSPYIMKLTEPENQAEFKKWVSDMGIWGVLLVLGIQMLQIVVAFIPGEPVELIAGVLYGTVFGTLFCLFGCVLASSLIFLISKKFGKRLLYRIFSEEKVKSWKWLQEGKRLDTVTFILFLIPGTPKDMLTYIVGVGEMSLGRFLLISTFARIPSIVSSTAVGDTMRQGEWQISIIIFAVTGLIGILGILYKDRLIEFCRNLVRRGKA